MVARPVRSVTLRTPIKSISPQGSHLETLRQYRTDQAYLRAVPPSAVFSNKLLTGIVTARPSTIVSPLKLRGIGPTRCQNYGRDIVRFVNLDSKGRGKLPARKPGGKKIKKINGSKAKSIKPPKIVTLRFFPLPSVPFQPAFKPALPPLVTSLVAPLLPKAQRIIPNLKLKRSVYVLEGVNHRVSFIRCQSPVVNHRVSITGCQSSGVNHWVSIIGRQLPSPSHIPAACIRPRLSVLNCVLIHNTGKTSWNQPMQRSCIFLFAGCLPSGLAEEEDDSPRLQR
jgi:hypothetical protein